jgi:16S rRNA (cytidine1402-2'-O)-methyltransferase
VWSNGREILGEVTMVLEGFNQSSKIHSESELVDLVLLQESTGEGRKESIASVAKALNLPKRQVFDAMVNQKAQKK